MGEQKTCKHTPMPAGYLARALWMEQKARTHSQRRCPECGLWAVWVRREQVDAHGGLVDGG